LADRSHPWKKYPDSARAHANLGFVVPYQSGKIAEGKTNNQKKNPTYCFAAMVGLSGSSERTQDMGQDNKPSKTKQAELDAFKQFCAKQSDLERLRTELLQCSDLIIQAKAIALSPLPYRKKNDRQLVRKIKVGEQTSLIVTYTALNNELPLPYGKDRRLLAWLQTQAKRYPEREGFVGSQYLSDFFKAFGLTDGGSDYRRFRESLERVMQFAVSVRLQIQGEGTVILNSVPVKAAFLPDSAKEVKAKVLEERTGQMALFREYDHPEYGFGIKLDHDFWSYLRDNPSVMPFALMQAYQDEPKKWDFAQYIFLRCGLAKEDSFVAWPIILDLMSSVDKQQRRVKADLKKHLEELKQLYPDLPAFFTNSGLVICPWRWRDEDKALRGL
jgi:hypothetical protein